MYSGLRNFQFWNHPDFLQKPAFNQKTAKSYNKMCYHGYKMFNFGQVPKPCETSDGFKMIKYEPEFHENMLRLKFNGVFWSYSVPNLPKFT